MGDDNTTTQQTEAQRLTAAIEACDTEACVDEAITEAEASENNEISRSELVALQNAATAKIYYSLGMIIMPLPYRFYP